MYPEKHLAVKKIGPRMFALEGKGGAKITLISSSVPTSIDLSKKSSLNSLIVDISIGYGLLAVSVKVNTGMSLEIYNWFIYAKINGDKIDVSLDESWFPENKMAQIHDNSISVIIDDRWYESSVPDGKKKSTAHYVADADIFCYYLVGGTSEDIFKNQIIKAAKYYEDEVSAQEKVEGLEEMITSMKQSLMVISGMTIVHTEFKTDLVKEIKTMIKEIEEKYPMLLKNKE